MSWTDDRIAVLRKLWAAGLTASQIATELGEGVTRNAVIGKAHRLELEKRPSPVKTDGTKRVRPAKKKAKAPDKKMVGLLDLTERMCKWPIGHPGDDDFHFCGKPSEVSMPYCVNHCADAYQAQPIRRDRRVRPSMSTR